jgi:hypothetical protein
MLLTSCGLPILSVSYYHGKMAGYLKGIVKEVVSGDTVVVVAATQGPAVPPEKRLTLSSLVAPRLVRRHTPAA